MKPLFSPKRIFFAVCAACVLCAAFVLIINIHMILFSKPYIYKSASAVPEKFAVILPGAKVYENGVSDVVRDRVEGTIRCVSEGKAERILVSGDHGRRGYDEVNQIRLFIERNYDIDESLVFLDHAGFSTYETMYRARDIFCVTDAIIVSQRFHLARCVYIARKLGLDAVAVEAPELTGYRRSVRASWQMRESLARVKTFFLVLFKAKPTYLGEKIPITESPAATRD